MNPFAQQIHQWQVFYTTVATACATLTGLLFVSLSLNNEILNSAENIPLKRKAEQAFSNFIFVLMFSLIFLIPDQSPTGTGLPLLLIGGYGLIRLGRAMLQARRIPAGESTFGALIGEFWLPLSAFLGLIAVAVFVLLGNTGSLYWLVTVMLSLIVSASRNAWRLLIGVQNGKEEDRKQKMD